MYNYAIAYSTHIPFHQVSDIMIVKSSREVETTHNKQKSDKSVHTFLNENIKDAFVRLQMKHAVFH